MPRCTSSFGRWSEPRIRCVIPCSRSSATEASWYVAEPSARRSVTPRRRTEPSSSRTAPPSASARSAASAYSSPRSLCRSGPSSHRNAQPPQVVQDGLLPSLDDALGIRVVDAQHEHAAVTVCERPVRHRGERVAEMERAGRARCEAHADRHQASIGTCPGCAATRSSQALIAGYADRSKPPSCATCVYAYRATSASV